MRKMLHAAMLSVEKRLFARGFRTAGVRRILAGQLLLAAVFLGAGLSLLWLSAWPMAFALGALLAAQNLWWLARSTQWCLGRAFTPGLALVHYLLFLGRFALTGVALYVLLIWLRTPVIPLLAGLSTVVVSLMAWGFARARHSFKEASHG